MFGKSLDSSHMLLFNSQLGKQFTNLYRSGSVGRAVASDTRGLQFESSPRSNYKQNMLTGNRCEDKIKKIEAGNGPFKKIISKLLWLRLAVV